MPDRPNASPELAAEQAYVDAAYARLEAMRAAAEGVREAYNDVRAGGTHQARLERDIAWSVTQRRLADLDIGEAPLMFGRLDMEDRSRWYVGRIAVEDEEHTPLVVDWRAPVSEPFYRATAVEPMHVVRRRHLISRNGRELVGLDDEVFDQEAIDEAGLPIAGEGALLAALERNRTGRMGDIVATIQAEQDEAIRADLQGPLVVAGGPGTGKTAVALHRAAYLLYTFRRRLGAQGVLLVGPSPVFLRYIEHVLPSLGEQDVQLSTIAGLRPSLRIRAVDAPAAGALKGDARMAKVIERAVADRQRPLRNDFTLLIDGMQLRVRRRETARLVEALRRRRGTHNEHRPQLVHRFVDMLVARYKDAAIRSYHRRADEAPAENVRSLFDRDGTLDAGVAGALVRGEAPPEGWEQELRGAHSHPSRGARGARPDVAGAVGARARQRPVRLLRARALGRTRRAHRRGAGAPAPRPDSRHREPSPGPKTTSRSSTKPTRISDRSTRRGRVHRRARRNATRTSIARHG